MGKFLAKRLLQVLLLVLAAVILVFSIINIIPGNPGRNTLGPAATQEAVDAFNEEIGYNLPFFQRLLNYLRDIIFKFDFGKSYTDGTPVTEILADNFKYTFKLTMLGVLVYVAIGLPLGILSAVKQYSAADNILRVTAMLLSAVPQFWLCMIVMLVFAHELGWLPSSGPGDWTHYVLPVTAFALGSAAGLLRTTRTQMLEAIRQDYIRTARAKGVGEATVIWKHALRNALLPLINSIGVNIGIMMGGTLIIENIFALPGLGTVSLTAINAKNIPVIMGCVVFLSAIFCVMVVLVDLVSALVDPRVRVKYFG